MGNKKAKILITDDMVTYRIILSSILRTFDDVEIVGSVKNGLEALNKIPECHPDIITLDVEMPVMDGLTALKKIKEQYPEIEVIMVSGANRKNADVTLKALQAGAFDFIVKPDATSAEEARKELSSALRKHISAILERKIERKQTKPLASIRPQKTFAKAKPIAAPSKGIPKKIELIAIGVSTGGPNALGKLLPRLSKNLPPILIVQHMPPIFTKSLAENLNKHTPLTVKEAEEGEIIERGTTYIAPGGRHMLLRRDGVNYKIGLNDNPPENSCRPAVDVLFRSIANYFPANHVLCIILTGMGSDGFKGVQALKRKGSYCIAQDEKSCVVYGMPRFIVENGLADEVLPLDEIAPRINKIVGVV